MSGASVRVCACARASVEQEALAVLDAAARGDALAAAELLRRPERVVPEVVDELARVRRRLRARIRGRRDAELVVEDTLSAQAHARGPRDRRGTGRSLRRDEDEVDLEAVRVEDAPFDRPAARRLLEKHQLRRAERLEPAGVRDAGGRVVDEERDVDVRPLVGGRVGARLRADDDGDADVLLLTREALEVGEEPCNALRHRTNLPHRPLRFDHGARPRPPPRPRCGGSPLARDRARARRVAPRGGARGRVRRALARAPCRRRAHARGRARARRRALGRAARRAGRRGGRWTFGLSRAEVLAAQANGITPAARRASGSSTARSAA